MTLTAHNFFIIGCSVKINFMWRQLKLSMRKTSSQLQQMSIRQRQELSNWSSKEKSWSFKELATLFLRSEAKCVTFPNVKILLTIAMVLPVSTPFVI